MVHRVAAFVFIKFDKNWVGAKTVHYLATTRAQLITERTHLMRLFLSALALLALLAPESGAADTPQPPTQHQMIVMSRNVYHGVDAEIFRVPGATSLPDLLNRVAAVFLGYQARNFPERAQALAAEVEATQPALVGLQEAVLVRTGDLFDPAPAETVAFDYVQILLNALAERGLHYAVVAEIRGLDIELPSALGFDVRHTDREVILARTDRPPGPSNSRCGEKRLGRTEKIR
jgi:hypothetical protein